MVTRNDKKVEILAPAGSFAALQAAVMAGCDAVYIGGSRFGARAYADNPKEDELLRAIDYAHLYGVKVYLTVNTLLKEDELSELIAYLKPYYLCGIDAVIVQDFGVLKVISETWPDLPIHASTQMTITNPESCTLLPKQVTRIVPARELTLAEIQRFRKETELELEIFCHGALCYSYSGQCLMSSLIGGRSGNRGRCAQPCRKRYELKGEKDAGRAYFLSPRDQCMLEHLPKLLAAGADSLKIEGRMKSPEYAAGVVAIYRKWVDRLTEHGLRDYRAEEMDEVKKDIRILADLYNRGGFSGGYPFTETGKEMMAVERPNHSGVRVGYAVLTDGNCCRVTYEEPVGAGDVLEIRSQNGATECVLAEYTAGAGEMEEARLVYLSGDREKAPRVSGKLMVYRTRNDSLLREIGKSCQPGSRRIPIAAIFVAAVDAMMTLTLIGETMVGVSGGIVSAAQKAAATREEVAEKLSKTGDTPYRLEPLEIGLGKNCFLPASKLNELRRLAVREYMDAVVECYRRMEHADKKSAGRACRMPDVKAKVEGAAQEEWGNHPFAATVMTVEQYEAVQKCCPDARIDIDMDGDWRAILAAVGTRPYTLVLPRITQGERLVRLELTLNELCKGEQKPEALVIRTLDAFALVKRLTLRLPLIADHTLYALNPQSAAWLMNHGSSRINAPFEAHEKELQWISAYPFEMVVYGRTVVMTSRQCVQKTAFGCRKQPGRVLSLHDEKGAEFPVQTCCEHCYNRIYNSSVLNLFPYMERIRSLDPAMLRLEFTTENREETIRVVREFFGDGASTDYVTRGHFKRGVL